MRAAAVKKLSDEELVERVIAGDTNLFAEVVERYQQPLHRYAMTLVHDTQVAQDIVQEALIKAYTNLRGFNTKRKFSSWVYRITHNQAMDYFRTQRRFTSLEDLPAVVQSLVSRTDVEASFDEQLLREKIEDVIDRLPVQYRSVVVLYYLEHKKYSEIGDVLKVPEGTVATWLRRAKKLLAMALQEYQPNVPKKGHAKNNKTKH